MKRLKESILLQSTVVANNRMNRSRQAVGINSYEQELDIHLMDYLTTKLKENGVIAWMDLCCGEGRALGEVATYFKGHKKVPVLAGLDLVDFYLPTVKENALITLYTMPILEWKASHSYDLITCIHGLHYIGDKLQAIAIATRALTTRGQFVAQLDLNHIKIEGMSIQDLFTELAWTYNPTTHLLYTTIKSKTVIPLDYLGADDTIGANYTGQPAVASYYCL